MHKRQAPGASHARMNHADDEQGILWAAPTSRVQGTHLKAFMRHPAVAAHLPEDADYSSLHRWSCEQPAAFWEAVRAYCGLHFDTPAQAVCEPGEHFWSTRWFPGATLNVAEHMLRYEGEQPALIAHREGAPRHSLSRDALRTQVAALAAFFREEGLAPGDRVAAIMPNVPETVVAMLATASLGAVWSSCSPDFGVAGILDRFRQIEPRWIIGFDGYVYNGKRCDTRQQLAEVAAQIPSIEGILLSELIGGDIQIKDASKLFVRIHEVSIRKKTSCFV